MKKILTIFIILFPVTFTFGQTKKVALFDLIKTLISDSTGYDSFGDWAVGHPATYPVQWQADRIEMSGDEKINFFRKGTANISVNGNGTTRWNLMLRGARSGFSSFNLSGSDKNIHPKETIDSLLGKKQYGYKLLQSCNADPGSGFYYYQLKIPKKVIAFLKVAWNCKTGNCLLSLDCYDDWSKQYANVTCPDK